MQIPIIKGMLSTKVMFEFLKGEIDYEKKFYSNTYNSNTARIFCGMWQW